MSVKKAHILLLLAGALISCNLMASKIDTIYFQNGDRITGEVKSLENNKLRLSTEDAGTLYVEWNHIDSVRILNSMRVVLDNGDIIYGKILPAGEVGMANIWHRDGDPILIALLRIINLSPMEDRIFDRLSGTLSSGFSYVKASQVMQMNLDASIMYQAQKNQMELSYSGLFSSDPTTGYSQNQNAGASFMRLLPRNWFFITGLTAESNSEMELDLRTSLGIGAGHTFIRTSRSFLYAAMGLQANRENTTESDQNNLESALNSKYSIFIYDDPEVSFTLEWDVIPSLSNFGRVRTNIDSNLKWEVFNDFFLKWTFFYNYDSRPLSGTAEKSDWAVTLVGIEYKL